MQRYVEQLIEDLDAVVQNPPAVKYYEVPPGYEGGLEHVAELASVPFQSIEELTGISFDAFPDFWDLSQEQCEAINDAIFRVFETLCIELVDKPKEIEPRMLYFALSSNWDYQVQYLPQSGFDMELCDFNTELCIYGEYCDCYDPETDTFGNAPPDVRNDLELEANEELNNRPEPNDTDVLWKDPFGSIPDWVLPFVDDDLFRSTPLSSPPGESEPLDDDELLRNDPDVLAHWEEIKKHLPPEHN